MIEISSLDEITAESSNVTKHNPNQKYVVKSTNPIGEVQPRSRRKKMLDFLPIQKNKDHLINTNSKSKSLELLIELRNILKCEQNCLTCNQYIIKLTDHFRKKHTHPDTTVQSDLETIAEYRSRNLNFITHSLRPRKYVNYKEKDDIINLEAIMPSKNKKISEPRSSPPFPDIIGTGSAEIDIKIENIDFCMEQFKKPTLVNPIHFLNIEDKEKSGNSIQSILLIPKQEIIATVEESEEIVHQSDPLNFEVSFDDFRQTLEEQSDYDDSENYDDHNSDSDLDFAPKGFKKRKTNKTAKIPKQSAEVEKKEASLPCHMCAKTFCGQITLNRHLQRGHRPGSESDPNNTFPVCVKCKKLFPNLEILNLHMGVMHKSNVTKDKSFACHICQKKFTKSTELNSHFYKSHPEEQPYVCEFCQKKFNLHCHYKDHIRRTHTGEKPFTCAICQKAYYCQYELKKHKKLHTGENLFIHTCEICYSGFRNSFHLQIHKRTHTGDKPFMCEICSKCFTAKRNLTSHMAYHVREKKFVCEFCSKSFISKSILSTHRKIHTGLKEHICLACGKAFQWHYALKHHMKIHKQ